MPVKREDRLPLQPLLEAINPVEYVIGPGPQDSATFDNGVPYNPEGMLLRKREGLSHLARLTGFSRRTMQRFRVDGIPVSQADRIAIHFGFHPFEIWGEDWWVTGDEEEAA